MTRMSVAGEVGQNIRRLRLAAGYSLAGLADAAELSKTTLHAIEQGEANPTLGTLWSLTTALHVSLGELLEPEPSAVTVVRSGEGAQVDGDAVRARLLHRVSVRGSVEFLELRVETETQRSPGHLPGVEEYVVVTHGGLSCGPEDGPVDLYAGDSAHYSASVPHIFRGLEDDNRALVAVIYQ